MSRLAISNEILSAGINQKGAELASIYSFGQEYLGDANPKYWARHSAILFPIVGKVKNNQYRIDNHYFEMGQHGFARDLMFQVVEHKENKVMLSASSNPETLKTYPYHFELQASYEIVSSTLFITYTVLNKDEQAIYFSLGAHPSFKCPLKVGEKRSDYYLLFPEIENATRELIEDGLRNGAKQKVLNGDNRIRITDNLFDHDALIFHRLKSNKVSLMNGQHKRILTFDFEGFPYLGIWSKSADAPFVCLEPWFGVADTTTASWDFRQKEGIVFLPVGESFACTHKVTIH